MDPNERKGWTSIITPDDLDTHMANIGQAQANAGMIKQMFKEHPCGPRVWAPGGGTCQMLDYITLADLGDQVELTLTDINSSFLEKAKRRLDRFQQARYELFIDDIEETSLKRSYDGVLVVLVLQHVEWQKALDSVISTEPDNLYIIIQEQFANGNPISQDRELPPSIKKFSKYAAGKLVPRIKLCNYISRREYEFAKEYKREVQDEKTMAGFVFTRLPTPKKHINTL